MRKSACSVRRLVIDSPAIPDTEYHGNRLPIHHSIHHPFYLLGLFWLYLSYGHYIWRGIWYEVTEVVSLPEEAQPRRRA